LQQLDSRRDIDALLSQLVRARAAVQSRRAELVRAETEVRNAESRLRTLVNDPQLGNSSETELIPTDIPFQAPRSLDLNDSMELALQNRPELGRAVKDIRAAGVRLNVSKNELLPALNVVLNSYVSGLRGQSNVGEAWLDQFRQGEPTYSLGLQYEMPLGNRAAMARYQRRRLELRQLEAQLQNTIQSLGLDVEVAVREVTTTYREMTAHHRAMEAARAEVDYIYDRWQLLPSTDRSAALLLEDILDSQERLNTAESGFLQAQLNYNLSYVNYLKSVGTLLRAERVAIDRGSAGQLPQLELHRAPDAPAPTPSYWDVPSEAVPAPSRSAPEPHK
jgi:outer membrane protein TolC